MKKILLVIFLIILWFISTTNWQNINSALEQSVWWMWAIDRQSYSPWQEWVRDFLIEIANKIMVPIIIVIWVLVAILWFYKIMFSSNEEEQRKWVGFLIWWVVWIMIMMSALFITRTLFWNFWTSLETDWVWLANMLYSNIVFPFFKIASYLIVWILFVILLIQAFKLLFWKSEEASRSAKTIFVWNILWIILLLSSTQIVELVYGKRQELWTNTSWLWNIWEWILSNRNIDFITNVINWWISFIAFIVLVIIIYQTFLLLTKPDDEDTMKKLRKNFVYVFIWVLVIWWGFLITNFLIIN